jgi:aminopeptidase YwaD
MRRLPLIAAVLALPAAAAHGAPTRHHEQPPRQPQQQQQQQQQRPTAYEATLHLTRTIGSRPAGSPGELRAHRYVAARFRAAGLRVGFERFAVPGRGRSRDVVGALDTPARCLTILMAHADTFPPGPGANDNASGVGVLTALAAGLRSGPRPGCDVWLVATGAEERPFTGQPDHLGARALVRRVGRLERRADLRLALSLDEVGRGGRFFLQSPHARPREQVEGAILAAARRANATVRFAPDSGTGNSDHREFELLGLPGAKLGVGAGGEPCRHMACDRPSRLDPTSLRLARRLTAAALRAR